MTLREIFTLISLISSVRCFESLLDESLYEIKWHDSLAQTTTERMSLMMTTTNNEKYQCLLPNIADQKNKNHGQESTVVPLEIELLKPLLDSSICFYKLSSYWTYELCHGKSLRQFHEHQKPLHTQEYHLGFYSREQYKTDLAKVRLEKQLGNNSKTPKKKVYDVEVPFYDVTYTDGTLCDLTGEPRKTHVQYVCNEDGGGELYDIKETSSCEYEAVVLTKDLCKHPNYGPKKERVHGIDCHPMGTSPTRPINFQRILTASMEERMQLKKSKVLESLWDVIYGLSDELDEEEITQTFSTPLEMDSDAHFEQQQQQQQQIHQQELLEQKEQEPPEQQQQPETHQHTSPPTLSDDAYRTILRNFLNGDECLTGGSGWWKYEICYKQTVKQYHETEEGRDEIVLGEWSEMDHVQWAQDAKKKTKSVQGRRYIYNYYSNGSYCKEKKSKRNVEVRLECAHGKGSFRGFIIYLIEPSVCSYELVVKSTALCEIIDSAQENGLINYP